MFAVCIVCLDQPHYEKASGLKTEGSTGVQLLPYILVKDFSDRHGTQNPVILPGCWWLAATKIFSSEPFCQQFIKPEAEILSFCQHNSVFWCCTQCV